jgi:long-chain acyl-CoA synthetase
MLVTTAQLYDKIKAIPDELPHLRAAVIKTTGQNLEAALAEAAGPPDGAELPPLSSPEPQAPAILFYTSGTTGRPKGVMLTQQNLTFSGANVAQSYGLREGDVTLAALPLVHVFANASPVLGSLSSGGTVIVMERFQTESVFEAIARHRVTWYPGVPTMFHYLLAGAAENPKETGTLRMLLSGGASLSVEALRELEEKFQTKVLEVYGLTESTGLVTANPVYGVRKPGSIGISVSGVDCRIIDSQSREPAAGEIGELVFRGPNACRGYWRRPDENRMKIKDGWVHTGDHAYRDEEGYFFIAGRDKELIITGGYNVYPREIEEVLYQHPDVQEAAVVGISHPEKGEIPKAVVVVKPGAAASGRDLEAHCRSRLAPYKVPTVSFMADLPKNATGKIMKNQLKQNDSYGG